MKKVKLVVFIIILLVLIFDTNLCFAQDELKVGRRRITTLRFTTTEPKVKWKIEDSSIAEIISTGHMGITIGSYFKGEQYAKVIGIKTGTTIIKAYNESGKLLQQGTLIVEEIKTDISKCEIPYIKDQEFTGDKIEPYIEITGENGIKLEQNIDYNLSYENNIEEGTAKVIITGIDTYTGKVERTFNIKVTQQPEPEEPEPEEPEPENPEPEEPEPENPEPENPEELEKPNDNIIDNTNTTMSNTSQNNTNINTSNENLYNENTSKNNISNSKVNNSKDNTIAPTILPKARFIKYYCNTNNICTNIKYNFL